jgi:hypothetical protein
MNPSNPNPNASPMNAMNVNRGGTNPANGNMNMDSNVGMQSQGQAVADAPAQ